MKQLLTILLLFIYSFSSIGATVKAHLCAGKIQKCFCGKSNKKDTCCAEKTTYIKKQDLHASSEVQSLKCASFSIANTASLHTQFAVLTIDQKNPGFFYSKKGYLFTGPPIYVLDCIYLI